MTKSSFDENAKDGRKKTSSLPSRQEFSSTLAPILTELNASWDNKHKISGYDGFPKDLFSLNFGSHKSLDVPKLWLIRNLELKAILEDSCIKDISRTQNLMSNLKFTVARSVGLLIYPQL